MEFPAVDAVLEDGSSVGGGVHSGHEVVGEDAAGRTDDGSAV